MGNTTGNKFEDGSGGMFMKGNSFLQDFVAINEGTEVPPLFAFWSGIGIVSAALGRNLWCEMGHYQFYSNLAIVLVGGAGRMRKSTAAEVGARMLRQLAPPPNFLPNKCSTEKLIDSLLKVETDDPQHLLAESSIGFLYVDELVTFLNRRSYDQGLGEVLMPLLDAKDEFKYSTLTRGDTHLKNVCLTMLGCSTPELLRDAIPKEAVGGGLTSRIIFVFCDTPMPPVLWTEFDDNKKRLQGQLIKKLQAISARKGEMKISQPAKDYLRKDYEKNYNDSSMRVDPYLKSYASRRHIHIIKVAMCLAAMSDMEGVEYEQMVAATQMVEATEKALPMMMRLITSSEEGGMLERVFSIIEAHGDEGIYYNELLEMVVHELKAAQLQEITETLSAMGRIEVKHTVGDAKKRRFIRVEKDKQKQKGSRP